MFAVPSLGTVFSAVFSEAGVRIERGLTYGGHARQMLDVYSPESGAGGGPVAVFIYGGGWRAGERATYGFVGAALASRGITTVIPDYRLYPEVMFPGFVEDAAKAYRWTARNVAGAGTSRPIFLIGHSAGAHIAGLMAVDAAHLGRERGNVPAPAGFIGLAGPYSFDPTTFETTRDIFASVTDAARARPTELVSAGAPPALVMHGLDDETVRIWNTRTFAAALTSHGVTVKTLEFPGIGHTGIVLALAWPFRWRAPVLQEIVGFIEGVTRQAARGTP
jgi:acetyl esterase/lipase